MTIVVQLIFPNKTEKYNINTKLYMIIKIIFIDISLIKYKPNC